MEFPKRVRITGRMHGPYDGEPRCYTAAPLDIIRFFDSDTGKELNVDAVSFGLTIDDSVIEAKFHTEDGQEFIAEVIEIHIQPSVFRKVANV